MAAAIDAGPGAVISHETAAALWRLPGLPAGAVHLTAAVGRWANRSSLATLHQSCSLPESHRRRVEGIAVTSSARTIFDLAGVLHPGRTERALDNALARRLTSLQALHDVTDALAQKGRPGSAVMRRLLADRQAGYVPPESSMEVRFESILRNAGLHTFVRQRDVGGDRWIGRVDYLDPDRKVIVEIDSDLYHSALTDQAADAERDAALAGAGYEVLRLKEHEVWHRPEEVVRRLIAR